MALKQKSFYLKKGDIIDVVAPASACSEENFKKALFWIKAHGFIPRYDKNIFKPELFLAQSDTYRFAQLKKALYSNSKAIWCVRGGYGSFRLWPELLKLKKKAQPKLFIGLSDVTSLHQFLNQKWNWPTLHAPLLDRLGQNTLPSWNEEELLKVVKNEVSHQEFFNLEPLNKIAQKKMTLQGKLRGGNLVTYMASFGTPLQPQFKKTDNILLFFEDIGERGYRVDRLLQQLKMSSSFKNVKGLIFGDFTEGLEPSGLSLVPDTLDRFAKDLKIPVFKGVQSGHGSVQRALFFNSSTTLYCDKQAHMIVYSPYAIK